MHEKSPLASAQLISSALCFVLFNLTLLGMVVYAFQSDVERGLFSENLPTNLLFIVFLGTAISSLSQYYLTYLKNSGLALNYVIFTVFQTLTNFAIVLLLLLLSDLKVLSLAYGLLVANALTFFLLSGSLVKRLPMVFDITMLKDMLSISLPLTPRVFFGLLGTQFDKIMLGNIGSTELVGIYTVGQKLSSTIFQFMNGLGRVFQPEVFRKLFASEYSAAANDVNDFLMPYFYASIFVAMLVALFSREFISVFFADEYSDAAIITCILAIYFSSFFFGKVTGNQLIFAKKTYTVTLLTLSGIFLNVGLNVPFILNWGIYGAASATTISSIIMTVISYVFAQRNVRISWEWRRIWLIYATLIAGVAFSIFDVTVVSEISALLGFVVKVAIVCIYVLLGFKLNLLSKKKLNHLKANILSKIGAQV